MIRFLIKGLMHDHHRSLFPVIVVTIGVFVTVFLQAWITGILGDFVNMTARFQTGHVKIMTRAYIENMDQNPNDLALLGANELTDEMRHEYPDMTWVERIQFGGLFDIPDSTGETRTQGTVAGFGIDLLSKNTPEPDLMNITKSIQNGRMPRKSREILISEDLANKLGVHPGDKGTLIGSTMYGSMAMYNFTIVGTVKFGLGSIDRGAIIADIKDVQTALDMEDAAGAILGFLKGGVYNSQQAEAIKTKFNAKYADSKDEYAPEMLQLRDMNDMGSMLAYMDKFSGFIVFVFVLVMSVVLWNVGLLGGLRRYNEMGLRLAMGEHKGHVYRSLIYESITIGVFGSLVGTTVGLLCAYWLQVHGWDFSELMKNTNMMFPSMFRTRVTTQTYYIGFFPGLLSTVLGTALSGIGIYRRQTAQLFKELEV